MQWVHRNTKDDVPTESGVYRVMVSGDSESVDGFTIYDFGDYETWAIFTRASPDEYEDFPGGYKGTFTGDHDEEDETILAYCGPIVWPKYNPKDPTT